MGDVWLITGQSNAAGYGKAPATDGPELGLHMFHADGRWKLATHPLADSTGTLYPPNREAANASHSPWLAFARRLKRQLGYPIGLIPASLGGSPVVAWDRKEDGCLFKNMLRYIEDSGTSVKGAVWYQGESDTGAAERKKYTKRFGNFVADLRSSLEDPSLPVITVQLNRCLGAAETDVAACHNWEDMREIQRRIAQKLSNVFIISIFDSLLSDGIHNGSAGNLIIGERAAQTALGGVYGQDIDYLQPECVKAKRQNATTVDLTFDHVAARLHYESCVGRDFPFAVRDRKGDVPVAGGLLPKKNVFRIMLKRALSGPATVTGAPGFCPPTVIPFDVSGFRPMLGFTMKIEE